MLYDGNREWAEHIIHRERHVLEKLSEIYDFKWYTYYRDFRGRLTGTIGWKKDNQIYYCYDRRRIDYKSIYFPMEKDEYPSRGYFGVKWDRLIPAKRGIIGLSNKAKRSWVIFINQCLNNLDPAETASYTLTKFLLEYA